MAVCKGRAQQNDIQHRLAIQKIEAENRQLKALLVSVGLSPDLIEQYLQLANHGTAVNRKVAIPAIQKQPEAASNPPRWLKDTTEMCESQPTSQSARVAGITPAEQPIGKSAALSDPPMCKCPTENQDSTIWPLEEDMLNSTMCAIAEELVSQYNTRGADPEEIRRRLWSGFRTGSSGNGCRVQNQILFQVLDELSEDV